MSPVTPSGREKVTTLPSTATTGLIPAAEGRFEPPGVSLLPLDGLLQAAVAMTSAAMLKNAKNFFIVVVID
jgi:hypothetical protein